MSGESDDDNGDVGEQLQLSLVLFSLVQFSCNILFLFRQRAKFRAANKQTCRGAIVVPDNSGGRLCLSVCTTNRSGCQGD